MSDEQNKESKEIQHEVTPIASAAADSIGVATANHRLTNTAIGALAGASVGTLISPAIGLAGVAWAAAATLGAVGAAAGARARGGITVVKTAINTDASETAETDGAA